MSASLFQSLIFSLQTITELMEATVGVTTTTEVVTEPPDSTITETDPDGAEVTAQLRVAVRCEGAALREGVPSAAEVRLPTK